MSRDYARIMTAIWRNVEFRSLDAAAQRMYLLLVTQPDITAAGVLALRLRRWADMSSDTTTDAVTQSLKALEAGRFIVVDWDAEEVLIRSFIRWDGGVNNPKRRPVIIRDAAEVVSVSISRHLVTEFRRCGITGPEAPLHDPSGSPNGRPSGSATDSLSGSHTEINNVSVGSDPFPQVDSLTDSAPTNHGVVDTYLSTRDTATHNPQPTTQRTKNPKTSSKIASRPRPDVDQLCEHLRAALAANEVDAVIGAQWRTAARLLIDRDRRPHAEALRLITWATTNHFWSTNVLSMPTFRKQYDKLRLQEKNEISGRHLKAVGDGIHRDPKTGRLVEW